MIPNRMSRAGHPSRVTIVRNTTVGNQAGLLSDSVVMADNIAIFEYVAIDRVIGLLPRAKVDAGLKHTLHPS